MAKDKVYKTPVKASQFVKALREKELCAEVIDDEDCYASVACASMSEEVEEPCSVTYSIIFPEDSPTRAVYPGAYRFELLGVVYEGSRSLYSEDDCEEESLSGREIVYDINPETKDLYTEKELLDIIHDEVDFPSYDADDYGCRLDQDDLNEIEEYLLDAYVYDEDDEDGRYYAVNKEGVVYLFDRENPHPEGEGFERISSEDAIERIVSNQQNFDEDYC